MKKVYVKIFNPEMISSNCLIISKSKALSIIYELICNACVLNFIIKSRLCPELHLRNDICFSVWKAKIISQMRLRRVSPINDDQIFDQIIVWDRLSNEAIEDWFIIKSRLCSENHLRKWLLFFILKLKCHFQRYSGSSLLISRNQFLII
jgi:hypothetical protein